MSGHPDAHPTRPWWRRTPVPGNFYADIGINGPAWYRIDGGVPSREEDLAAHDERRGLPADVYELVRRRDDELVAAERASPLPGYLLDRPDVGAAVDLDRSGLVRLQVMTTPQGNGGDWWLTGDAARTLAVQLTAAATAADAWHPHSPEHVQSIVDAVLDDPDRPRGIGALHHILRRVMLEHPDIPSPALWEAVRVRHERRGRAAAGHENRSEYSNSIPGPITATVPSWAERAAEAVAAGQQVMVVVHNHQAARLALHDLERAGLVGQPGFWCRAEVGCGRVQIVATTFGPMQVVGHNPDLVLLVGVPDAPDLDGPVMREIRRRALHNDAPIECTGTVVA